MSLSNTRKAGGKWKSTRHDKWYTLAKEQGFRSRAAFKLIQINKKYDLLSSAKACLDLCAAPGGWLQVAVKYMPVSSLLVGIDLLPIRPLKGATTIQGDITTPECRTQLKKELQGWDVDLVLHDGAPNVAGGQMWSRDAYVQNELVLHSLRLATQFLRPDGNFVTKVFRSQDYNALLFVLKQLFRRVDVCKPMASRDASAEIFVVCLGYLAPKKIDPQLLNPSHVFQQFDDGDRALPVAPTLQSSMDALSTSSSHASLASLPNYVDVFKTKSSTKTQRSRHGYDDVAVNSSILSRTLPAHTFVNSDDPIVLLGSLNAFTFADDASKLYLSHAKTTPEVITLCEDLKVLGKGDLKVLMRWRKAMRDWRKKLEEEAVQDAEAEQALAEAEAKKLAGDADADAANADAANADADADAGADGEGKDGMGDVDGDDDNDDDDEEEAQLTEHLRELRAKRMAKLKKDARKKHAQKMKTLARLQLNKNALTEAGELVGAGRTAQDELFSLSMLRSKDVLDTLDRLGQDTKENADTMDALADIMMHPDDDLVYDSEEGVDERGGGVERADEPDSDADSDDESSYMRTLEHNLDEMYERYKEKRRTTAARKNITLDADDPAAQSSKKSSIPSAARADFDVAALVSKKRKRSDEDDGDDDDGEGGEDDEEDDDDDEDDDEDEEEPSNPLMVDLAPAKKDTSAVKMNRWFERDLFTELDMEDAMREQAAEQRKAARAAERAKAATGNKSAASKASASASGGDAEPEEDAEDEDDDSSSDDENDASSYMVAKGDENGNDADDDDEDVSAVDPALQALRARRLAGAASVSKSHAQLEVEARRERVRAKNARRAQRRAERMQAAAKGAGRIDDDGEDGEEDEDENEDGLESANATATATADDESADVPHLIDQDSKKKAKKMARLERRRLGLPSEAEIERKKEQGFEEVPLASDMSSDDEAVSQTLALGHHLLDKRKREDMFDSTYNRYTYDDEDMELPAWFREDERRHSIIQLPVTKQEVDLYREQLKMINARPIRKIAEAKARKAHRTEMRWEKIKKQAESIEKDESKSMNERLRQIEGLYKKTPRAKMQKKQDRVYQVVRKGGGSANVKMRTGNSKGRVVKVDPRMKKDKRGVKTAGKRDKRRKATQNKRRRKV